MEDQIGGPNATTDSPTTNLDQTNNAATQTTPPVQPGFTSGATVTPNPMPDPNPKPNKTWLIILITLIVLCVAGYFVYSKFFANTSSDSSQTNVTQYEIVVTASNDENNNFVGYVYIPKSSVSKNTVEAATKEIMSKEGKGKNNIAISFYDDKDAASWAFEQLYAESTANDQAAKDALKDNLTHYIGMVTNPSWIFQGNKNYPELKDIQIKP